jgi:hypothetical protein
MRDPLQWFDPNADNPPWIKALAEVRRLASREGWRYQHVQAIIVSIDQYAEAVFARFNALTIAQADDIRINELGPVIRASGNIIELVPMNFSFRVAACVGPRALGIFSRCPLEWSARQVSLSEGDAGRSFSGFVK